MDSKQKGAELQGAQTRLNFFELISDCENLPVVSFAAIRKLFSALTTGATWGITPGPKNCFATLIFFISVTKTYLY